MRFPVSCIKYHATQVARSLSQMHVIVLVSVIASLSLCSARGPPLILEVSPMNAPTVGGKIITIYGENFGDKSEGLSIDIRGFPCPEVVLQSPTRALCEVPPGLGTGHEFILTTMDGTQVVKSTSAPAAKFSYDAPYVNIVMPGNGPTTGGTQITVSGKNFGMAINHPNPEVTIGGKNCLQSIWEHDGKVKCVSPSGIGIGNVVVYLQGQQSQAGYDTIYEYDEPVVTGVNPDHGPTGGGSKITVLGKNFGVQDSRPTVSVGHTPCTLTVWQSDSSIVCTVPSGQGHDHLLEATIIGAHSKENALVRFSFDSPVVSAVSPANIPPTDAIALTLYGEAFGGPDAILNAFIGPTKCLKTSWTSSTTLSCTTPAGTGGARSIILVAGDTTYPVASAAEMSEGHVARVSYDAPIITAIVPATGATSGSEELTLWGRNFGGKPQNVRVSVGGTACLNANWQSDAEVTCRLSPGTGSSNVVLLTVDGQSSPSRIAAADGSTYEPIVVFQPPSLSSISPSVGKPQGGVLITVEGANFGTDKAKVQVLFGKHAGKVLRAEETNLLVLAPAGEGEDEVKVTVDGQASKLSGLAENVLFRYDGPSITSLSVDHGPTVGGTVIDISGSNLGANGLQLSIAVGGIPCISVQWISSTSSQCTSPPGVGGSHIIEMSIDGTARANSGAFRFSYDRPIIESVEPSLFSESGGDRIAILGRNFGEVEGRASQMIVQVGRTQCAQTSWVSDAELDCTTPPGPLGDAAITVRISGQASSAFTVERTKPGAAPPPPRRPPPPPATPAPPAAGIIGIKPDHASPSGGDLISIFGTGFNSRDGEPEVAFGRFGCYQSQTVSATELVCRLPSGVGAALRPSVSYPGQPIILGPENLRFSYNAPIVTSVTPSKGSVLGGDMITMTGSNFGDGLSNIEGYVGDNQCLESSYVSASEITCLTPHGSSQPQPLFVQAGGQRGSASRATFLFLGRMIDSVSPDHMRTSGGSRVVIKSSSFTKADYTEVLIGGKRCNGTQWQSLNAVSCIVPAGVGGNLDVSVMLGSDVWNGFGSFSYDAATVQRIDPSEGPSAGKGQQHPLKLLTSHFDLQETYRYPCLAATSARQTQIQLSTSDAPLAPPLSTSATLLPCAFFPQAAVAVLQSLSASADSTFLHPQPHLIMKALWCHQSHPASAPATEAACSRSRAPVLAPALTALLFSWATSRARPRAGYPTRKCCACPLASTLLPAAPAKTWIAVTLTHLPSLSGCSTKAAALPPRLCRRPKTSLLQSLTPVSATLPTGRGGRFTLASPTFSPLHWRRLYFCWAAIS